MGRNAYIMEDKNEIIKSVLMFPRSLCFKTFRSRCEVKFVRSDGGAGLWILFWGDGAL